MNKRGVTLLELIIVMVIIAIGSLALAPNIGSWISNYRLRSATRDVASILRTAQAKAVSSNLMYGVGFDANSCQLYRSSGGLSPEGGEIRLPTGIQFNNNTFQVNPDLGKPFAQFNTDSTSGTGGVTLRNTKGSQKRITLTTSTGRIKID